MDVGVNLKEDKKNTDDLKYDFMPDILEIIERPANRWGKTIIWFSVAFAVALFIWSMVSKMDVVILARCNQPGHSACLLIPAVQVKRALNHLIFEVFSELH